MVSGITQFYLTYKRIVCFSTEPNVYTGLGIGGERLTSEIQGTDTNQNDKINTMTHRGLVSILFVRGKNRVSIDGSYLDNENCLVSLSYGLRL